MAWKYEENFNSLNTAALNGQDSWSGDSDFGVQTSVTAEGAKAVKVSAGNKYIASGDFSGVSSGNVVFAMRKSSTTSSNNYFAICFGGSKTQMMIIFDPDGDIIIKARGAGNDQEVLASFSVDTWYQLEIEFNIGSSTYKARIREYGESEWSEWSGNASTYNSYDTIKKLELFTGSGMIGDAYYDDFRPAPIPVVVTGDFFQLF